MKEELTRDIPRKTSKIKIDLCVLNVEYVLIAGVKPATVRSATLRQQQLTLRFQVKVPQLLIWCQERSRAAAIMELME